MASYAIGLDYGTNSVRALLVDLSDGTELAANVFLYPSGEAGILLDDSDPNLARQNPADYIEGAIATIREVLAESKIDPAEVVAIGVDTTGSSPMPVNQAGTPLAMLPDFKDKLAAYCWLWKDHTSFAEAEEITTLAEHRREPYLAKCGGTYSSEWFWSKILHCARTAPEVFDAAFSWVEICDFVPAYLCGNTDPLTLKRSICAAGHKAMFADAWGGLPSKDYLGALDPRLADLRDRLYSVAFTSDQVAGHLSQEMAEKTGLTTGTVIAVGAFDAHLGAVGSGIKPGTLVKIMGTSTCDCMVAPDDGSIQNVPGVCGLVPGSILPGMIGVEAGQSAVGDIFNWFVNHLCPPEFAGEDAHVKLTEAASQLKPGESGLLALDWNNGNRTILVDPLLTGQIIGLTLHSTAPEVYRALVEATAFGALKIIRRLQEYGVQIEEVVNCGGIAEKSPFTMQIYADICNMPMKVSRSSQTPALGAALMAGVAAGAVSSVADGVARMTGVKDTVYSPIPENVAIYAQLFALYETLHDAFGGAKTSQKRSIQQQSDEGTHQHPKRAAKKSRLKC